MEMVGHGWEHPAATGRWVLEYVRGVDTALLDRTPKLAANFPHSGQARSPSSSWSAAAPD